MTIKRDKSQTLSNIHNDVAIKKDRRLKAVQVPAQSESVCHSSPSKPKNLPNQLILPQNLPSQPALNSVLLLSKKPTVNH